MFVSFLQEVHCLRLRVFALYIPSVTVLLLNQATIMPWKFFIIENYLLMNVLINKEISYEVITCYST